MEMEKQTTEFQRQTAYKIWITDLMKGNYIKSEQQFEAGYAEIKGKKITRINLIGGIIDKTVSENNISFMLDDGSGSIRLRAFADDMKKFTDINVGDLVILIGKAILIVDVKLDSSTDTTSAKCFET